MGKLIPVILAVLGLSIGAAAGHFLAPGAPDPADGETSHDTSGAKDDHADASHGPEKADKDHNSDGHAKAQADGPHGDDGHGDDGHGGDGYDYVKLNNQFVVPVVEAGRVASLVVMSLSLEVSSGQSANIYQREPKLRDALLDVMFDHANAGGFAGAFTESGTVRILRMALREAAQKIMGDVVHDVLIVDLMRQDS